MNVLGIDPGQKGALALVASDATLIDLVDMPTIQITKTRAEIDSHRLVEILEDWRGLEGEYRVLVERQQAMPKQGAASGFTIGQGYGVLLGIFSAQKVSHEIVQPKAWQGAVLGKIAAGTSKDRSRLHAQRLYPEADLGRRKDEGRSDAVCIALYGLEKWREVAA